MFCEPKPRKIQNIYACRYTATANFFLQHSGIEPPTFTMPARHPTKCSTATYLTWLCWKLICSYTCAQCVHLMHRPCWRPPLTCARYLCASGPQCEVKVMRTGSQTATPYYEKRHFWNVPQKLSSWKLMHTKSTGLTPSNKTRHFWSVPKKIRLTEFVLKETPRKFGKPYLWYRKKCWIMVFEKPFFSPKNTGYRIHNTVSRIFLQTKEFFWKTMTQHFFRLHENTACRI